MSQTILIEENEELRKIFSLNLQTFVGTDVILRNSADDTIELLRILPQVNLVVTRARIDNDETALRIFNFIKSENLETSMIIIGECPQIAGEVLCLQETISWEILVNEAAKQLGVTLQDVMNKIKPTYLPVGIHYFFDIEQTPCDVYIRIKQGPNEYQFMKRIHSKDHFEKGMIQRYAEFGLKEFYIPKDYIQYFTTFVTSNLVSKLEQDDLGLEERILTTSNAHDIIQENVVKIGFDHASIELTEASINSMVKSVKKSPEVAALIKFLFSNKVSMAYQHCHLQTLMCHYILSKQSWYKPEDLETLSFASFFADITLKSKTQMQISSMKEFHDADLTDNERYQVLNHAKDAAALLNGYPETSEIIKTVILQSHGRFDGVGFEDDPNEEIHPLSKVFIVADNFVKILLHPDMPSNKTDILAVLSERFSNPSYQKIIKALEQRFQ